MKRRTAYLAVASTCAALALIAVPPATAQSDGTTPACELHVFPIRGVLVHDATQNRSGGLVSGLINGAFSVKRPEEISAFIRSAVPHADELAILKSVDYGATARGKAMRVIVHDEPYLGDDLSLKTFKTSPPVQPDAPSCYRELVLSGFYYEKSTVKKSVKLSYFYREYTDQKMSRKAEFGAGSTAISNFPPDGPDEAEAARTAVRSAYRGDLLQILNKT